MRVTSQFIIQPFFPALLFLQTFRQFTYVTTHSPTLPSLYLRHSSLSNPSVASPTSQFNLQPFFLFSYITSSSLNSPGEPLAHSPNFPSLHLRHNSFSNPSVALPTSQLILNPSVASPTSQFILQTFFRFSYVTTPSLNSPAEPPMVFIPILFNEK